MTFLTVASELCLSATFVAMAALMAGLSVAFGWRSVIPSFARSAAGASGKSSVGTTVATLLGLFMFCHPLAKVIPAITAMEPTTTVAPMRVRLSFVRRFWRDMLAAPVPGPESGLGRSRAIPRPFGVHIPTPRSTSLRWALKARRPVPRRIFRVINASAARRSRSCSPTWTQLMAIGVNPHPSFDGASVTRQRANA